MKKPPFLFHNICWLSSTDGFTLFRDFSYSVRVNKYIRWINEIIANGFEKLWKSPDSIDIGCKATCGGRQG